LRMRPCATALRRIAACSRSLRVRSSTYWPRPRRKRRSSKRSTGLPTNRLVGFMRSPRFPDAVQRVSGAPQIRDPGCLSYCRTGVPRLQREHVAAPSRVEDARERAFGVALRAGKDWSASCVTALALLVRRTGIEHGLDDGDVAGTATEIAGQHLAHA